MCDHLKALLALALFVFRFYKMNAFNLYILVVEGLVALVPKSYCCIHIKVIFEPYS